jgi:hypothetical protein
MSYKDKKKNRETQAVWYEKHRLEVNKAVRAQRTENRAKAITTRGGRCIACGSTANLEFHHRNRKEKETQIATLWSRSEEFRENELAKCDLLCTECHKTETAKERGYGTAPHGTLTSYNSYRCRCKICRIAKAQSRK